MQSEEEDRLSLFSLRQVGSLEEYIQNFTRPGFFLGLFQLAYGTLELAYGS